MTKLISLFLIAFTFTYCLSQKATKPATKQPVNNQKYNDPPEYQCMMKLDWTQDKVFHAENHGITDEWGIWQSCILEITGQMKNGKLSDEYFKKEWNMIKQEKEMEYKCLQEANKRKQAKDVTKFFAVCYNNVTETMAKRSKQ